MNLPDIKFKFTNTDSSEKLQEFAESKFNSLTKFIGDNPVIFEVEFERMTTQNTGNVYRVEANLDVNGKFYRAESTSDNFEMSLDEVNNELNKEIARANGKKETLFKRGARSVKNLLRFGRE